MRRITEVSLPNPHEIENAPTLWWLLVDQKNIVRSMNRMEAGISISGESWQGDLISPMGLDLQINGGIGLAFSELTFTDLPKLFTLLDQLWFDGVDAICPTIVSCEVESLRQALLVLREARKQSSSKRCVILGAHLEGPFIASGSHGAHPLSCICSPSLQALDQRINGFENEIALVTLAPELKGSIALIERLRKLGVVVSLGHSSADAETAGLSFDHGISMLTHTFNAMPGLGHRAPGPVGKAIERGGIAMGLIADGIHVDPAIAVLLHRLASDQLVLISDALSPYGLKEEGQHQWDERLLIVNKGTCRLEDGTLVGTAIPLLEGCIKLARWTGDPSAAIWAATVAPRCVLGQGKLIQEHLIGKTLNQLLRWRFNSDVNELRWRRAA